MAKKDVLKGRSIVNRNVFDHINQKLDEIKRANPVKEYLESIGVSFVQSESGILTGFCPFHKDIQGSITVHEKTQYFECSGCGQSGTVIDAVSLYEKITADEAIKRLEEQKKPLLEPFNLDKPEKEEIETAETLQETGDIFPPPAGNTEAMNGQNDDYLIFEIPDDEEITETVSDLNHVIDFYHRKLYENREALEYLEKQGIKTPQLLSLFKIGYADGSILSVIGESQTKELIKAGILDETGFETFYQHLTFPLLDENERINGIYGYSIQYNKGFYQGGGIFNIRSSKVYDEMILVPSVLEALRLIDSGLNNIQPINDDYTLTDLHLKKLIDDRVVTLIITDSASGQQIDTDKRQALKEQLLAEGFRVKMVSGKGLSGETLKEAIAQAEVLQVKDVKSLDVRKDGITTIFTINGITYRLSGLKELFVSNLKVNIRSEMGENRYFDNLDLYSARSRTSYSLNLANMFGIESKRVEKDLIRILETLEEERDRKLSPEKEEVKELTEEERRIGLEFLKSPDLFQVIIRDMEVLGYAGEDLNKILLYLSASSRIMDDPISVMIISQSASGKSYLIETLRKLLPAEDVIAVTSLSDQALNYMGDLLHKFLIMGEAVHNETIEHQIREMLSNRELSRLVTQKDEKTGKMESRVKVTKTVVSMVMGGTKYDINPENASRFFIVNADESAGQTKRIHEIQKEKHSLERKYLKEDVIPGIILKHQSAQRLLRKIMVVNPFREYLEFPSQSLRSRRDFDRFIDLIAVVCFLRQYQKEEKSDGRFSWIECDLKDYEIAYRIMIQNVLPATMSEVPKSAVMLYEGLRMTARDLAESEGLKIHEVSFTQREIRESTGFGQSWIKQNLRVLVEFEYVSLIRGTGRGERFFYRLKEDKPITEVNLSMIPTVAEIEVKLQ